MNPTDYGEIVERVAGSYAGRYSYVELDDCRQELWVELYKPWVWKGAADATNPDAYVGLVLWHRAQRYEREMANQALVSAEDRYVYSAEVVKAMLPVALAYREEDRVPAWPTGDEEDAGTRSNRDPAEGNNLSAMLVDVLKGFDTLDGHDQGLLRRIHLDGLGQTQVAGELQVTPEVVYKRHQRAVDDLIDAIGGRRRRDQEEHDGPGARVAMSNADAIRSTE